MASQQQPNSELLSDLEKQIRSRQAVIFVGAGVSLNSSGGSAVASWRGLLATGVERCESVVNDLPKGWSARVLDDLGSGDLQDLLSAAEKVESKLIAQGEYRRWLRDTVGSLKVEDPSCIAALRKLQCPLVTTNYDSLIEQVTGLEPISWKGAAAIESILRGDESGVVHLHGYWRDPESVILV